MCRAESPEELGGGGGEATGTRGRGCCLCKKFTGEGGRAIHVVVVVEASAGQC